MASVRPLSASFRFAWDGLVDGAVRERNLRIHLGLGALAASFAAVAPLAPAERAVLVLCVAVVIAAEAANSALEAAVDLASPGPHPHARLAKDSAAGAVLALSAGSVLAAVALVAPRAGELRAWAAALGLAASARLGVAAALGALAAAVLPSPSRRSRAADRLLAVVGGIALADLALRAESLAAWAVAWLCLTVGAAGAARRRASPPVHSG